MFSCKERSAEVVLLCYIVNNNYFGSLIALKSNSLPRSQKGRRFLFFVSNTLKKTLSVLARSSSSSRASSSSK